MKSSFAFSLLVLFSLTLSAQSLSLSTSQLSFGPVTETSPLGLGILLTNTGTDSLFVRAFLPQPEAFTLSQDSFLLGPGAAASLTITFSPRHNVLHNRELILLTNEHRGAYRVDLLAQGRYSMSYYASTENLSGEPLKAALKARLAQGFTQLSYNQARDEMFMVIDNKKANGQGASTNTLTCVYTGTTITGFTDRTSAQLMGFNTEHTYPQGLFGQALPMRSDIHHLFPTTEASNSERANKPFGVVGNPGWQVGGSKSSASLFEPRDDHKGTVARAMLYFALRYQDYQGFLAGQEAILRQWHQAFPPVAADIARNNRIATAQGNRNPWVDYPQFIERISSVSGTATVAPVRSWHLPEQVIDFDTITGPAVYRFPLVNTGNQPLTFEAPSFSDARLKESSGLSFPYVVEPGEALPLELSLQTTGSPGISDTLRLRLAGSDEVLIPVLAFWTLEASLSQAWPVNWRLAATDSGFAVELDGGKPRSWSLFEMGGRMVQQGSGNRDRFAVPMMGQPQGVYLLRVEENSRFWVKRVRW